jgi:PAS domain S-box-containing protein
MKIRTQIIISIIVSVLIIAVIGTMLFFNYQQLSAASENEQLADDIVRGSYALSNLQNDYLLHNSDRSRSQWEEKYDTLQNEFSRLRITDPVQQETVKSILESDRQLNEIFSKIVASPGSNGSSNGATDPDLIQIRWNRLGIQTQEMIFGASRLSELVKGDVLRIQQDNNRLVIILISALLLIMLMNFLMVNRYILRSLESLQKGAGIIGSGNLDHTIDESSKDEIGELSHAFNQMTSNLKAITASKTDLEKEIADRKRAEQSAKESLELYQTLAESAKDIIFICDPAGNLRFFNKNGAAVFGTSVDDLIGKNLEQVFPPENAREQRKQLDLVLESKKPLFAEINIHFPKINLWLDIQLIPIFTERGTIKSVMGVARDITMRKQAEEHLTESNERFKNVARATNDIVWDWDLATDHLWWNEAIYTVFGYQHDDIEQTIESWYTRIHPEDRDRTVASIHSVIDGGGQSWSGEYRFRKADSSYAYVFDRGFVIHDNRGNTVRMVGAMLDITERKRAEAALKNYSEKLEEMVSERTRELREAQEQLVKKEKLAVLGKLSGGVGHELRNPLGAIKNVAYFLNMALENPDEEIREMIGILNKEVARSEDIISSLLDFARPKVPVLAKVEVSQVMTETLKRFPVPQNITLVNTMSSTLPKILADSNQLIQVFGNLITNAYQAMPEGGILTISSKERKPGWIALSVADTGAGISEKHMKKLFEPLFTTKAKGIGLGLVVIKTIIEAHGGRIEVKSDAGKGAIFTVILPILGNEGVVK